LSTMLRSFRLFYFIPTLGGRISPLFPSILSGPPLSFSLSIWTGGVLFIGPTSPDLCPSPGFFEPRRKDRLILFPTLEAVSSPAFCLRDTLCSSFIPFDQRFAAACFGSPRTVPPLPLVTAMPAPLRYSPFFSPIFLP